MTLNHDRDHVCYVCMACMVPQVRASASELGTTVQGTDMLASETSPHPELTIEFMQLESFPAAVIPNHLPSPPAPSDASYTTCTPLSPCRPLIATYGWCCPLSVLVRKVVSISDNKTRWTERHQTGTHPPVQRRIEALNPNPASRAAETSPRIVPCPASQRPEILNRLSADHEVRQNTSERREPQASRLPPRRSQSMRFASHSLWN